MQQLREQIAELSRKQACRPNESDYGQLIQELQHYLCSIGQKSSIDHLLSRLLNTLQGSSSFKSRSMVQGLLKEVAVWQKSQQHFCQKLVDDFPLYPDVVGPIQTGILQLRHGMSLVASQLATLLTPVPGLPKLVSCLLGFPTLSNSFSSHLARADFLFSHTCTDILHCLVKLLPQQDYRRVVPQASLLRLNALLYVQCHALCTGEFTKETFSLFTRICQVRKSIHLFARLHFWNVNLIFTTLPRLWYRSGMSRSSTEESRSKLMQVCTAAEVDIMV